MLHLFALIADGCLQGTPDALAIPSILRRLARSFVRRNVCRLSPEVFDEHAAVVASGAAVSARSAQRRDQYHRFQSALAAVEGARTAFAAHGGQLVSWVGRQCQRLRELR